MAAAPPPPSAGIAAVPMTPALPAKRSRVGRILGLIFLLIIAAIVIANITRPKSKADSYVAPVFPSLKELQDAQKAGLSKDFATQGWILHRYAMNKYPPLLGMGTDEGLTIPSDEDLRASLSKLKSLQQSEADKVAFQRMTALLWATHTANQLRSRGDNDPAYKQVFNVASDCFAAVNNSFEGGTGLAAAPAIHRCLNVASKARADMEKQGLSNWENP